MNTFEKVVNSIISFNDTRQGLIINTILGAAEYCWVFYVTQAALNTNDIEVKMQYIVRSNIGMKIVMLGTLCMVHRAVRNILR